MSAPVRQCQPKISELMAELRHHEAEYPELIHGPLCGQAADRIQELTIALREIAACAETGEWTLPSTFANRARAALEPGA